MTNANVHLNILRRPAVEARTGLSRSTIYDKLAPTSARFDPTFPKPIRIGLNAVGWVESELDEWLTSCLRKSRPS